MRPISHDATLARVREFVAAEPPGDQLERLCQAAVRALMMDGAGITVMANGDRQGLAAASDAFSASIEDLQFGLGEGPSRDVHDTGRPVLVGNLAATARWPVWTAAALAEGVRAVFAFPLQVGAARLGALTLHQRVTGSMTFESVALALGFADVALALLVDGDPREDVVGHRVEVYQAQGMLQVQLGVGPADALARLRAYAYAHDRLLGDVAQDVVARRLTFAGDDRGES